MISTTFALGVLCFAFYILFQIQSRCRHLRNAKAQQCKPPVFVNPGAYGISSFLEMLKEVKKGRFVEYIAGHYPKYGTTFQLRRLVRTPIFTIEPENIKAILATKFDSFSLGTRLREFYPLLGDGIFTLDGGGWSHARRLLRPQFKKEQIADIELLESHVSNFLKLIPVDGSVFDIQRLFFLLTMELATLFLFGEAVGCMSTDDGLQSLSPNGPKTQEFAEAFNIAQGYLLGRTRAQAFYWLINPSEFREAICQVHKIVDYYVDCAIKSRESQAEPMRYIFSNALAADTDEPKVLRDNMLNILLAGRDTTASLLSSTFFFLSRHPTVWSKLRQAIFDEFGDAQSPKKRISQSALKNIIYLRYTLNEVLRLLPPVPLNYRVATRDTFLPLGGGADGKFPVYIRKGQVVNYSVYAMHRRTDLWGSDASEFRPERWKENAKRGWEFLPFNGGPRICLGQQYALTEASYTIVRIMQRFSTIICGDLNITEPVIHASLTLSHANGVMVTMS
ncbi:putative cytochrome P450 alkane hydroxylase [Aspergillus insuetus]